MKYENDKLLRESIKLKESEIEKSSNKGEIKNGKGKKVKPQSCGSVEGQKEKGD